jgi:hypothetical protein
MLLIYSQDRANGCTLWMALYFRIPDVHGSNLEKLHTLDDISRSLSLSLQVISKILTSNKPRLLRLKFLFSLDTFALYLTKNNLCIHMFHYRGPIFRIN